MKKKNDLITAISFIIKKEGFNDDLDIYLVGFSLGATIALMIYERFQQIKALSLWSPAFFPNRDMYPRYQNEAVLNSLNKNGYFLKSGLKVGEKIINDLAKCNIAPFLKSLDRPTLIIHGEQDEKIDFKSSVIASQLFNGHGNLRLLPSGHSFRSPSGIRNKVFNETCDFFNSIRPESL